MAVGVASMVEEVSTVVDTEAITVAAVTVDSMAVVTAAIGEELITAVIAAATAEVRAPTAARVMVLIMASLMAITVDITEDAVIMAPDIMAAMDITVGVAAAGAIQAGVGVEATGAEAGDSRLASDGALSGAVTAIRTTHTTIHGGTPPMFILITIPHPITFLSHTLQRMAAHT